MTIEAPGRQHIAVQMLRGIAALMVVFVHIDTILLRLGFGKLGTSWLATGVDIFFVISGFIMWTSVEQRGGISAGEFLKNRIIRIVPLYWLVTAVIAMVALVAPQVMRSTVLRPDHVITSFLFLPDRHPVFPQHFWPLAIPGWSLNYEMLFYAIFAGALLVSNGNRLRRLLWIAGSIVTILVVGTLLRNRVDVLIFYANPMLLEFIAGILIGIGYQAKLIRHSYIFGAVVLAGFAVLWAGTHYPISHALVPVAATIIVAGTVFLPALADNAVSRLGDASYSLYLTHSITLAALAWALAQLNLDLSPLLVVISCVAAAIAIAFAMYRLFEVPVTKALKRRRPRVTAMA